MTWSRLTLLCTPQELSLWLEACMERFELVPLVFRTPDGSGTIHHGTTLPTDGVFSRIVLLPPADASAADVPAGQVPSLERGWLEARPGAHVRGDAGETLLVSELLAPTRPVSPNRPADWLRWLKRRVRADGVRAGVRGRDELHGGDSVYRDIRYSRGALDLFRAGTTWRPSAHGNVVFVPIDHPEPRGVQAEVRDGAMVPPEA